MGVEVADREMLALGAVMSCDELSISGLGPLFEGTGGAGAKPAIEAKDALVR